MIPCNKCSREDCLTLMPNGCSAEDGGGLEEFLSFILDLGLWEISFVFCFGTVGRLGIYNVSNYIRREQRARGFFTFSNGK